MTRLVAPVCALSVGLLMTSCGRSRLTAPVAISLGASIRLPVQYLGAPAVATKLTISPGAEDELSDGPSSFDVMADGRLAIADPLARRIAVFDQAGAFSEAIPVGFAVDGVVARRSGFPLARNASTGDWYEPSSDGRYTRPADAPRSPTAARLIGENGAYVPSEEGADGGIALTWQEAGTRLLAVEHLAGGGSEPTFVALDVTPGDLASVRKIVRAYAPSGDLLAEAADAPLDYFVVPRHEFRLDAGRLYQLQPLAEEVRINVWDFGTTERRQP